MERMHNLITAVGGIFFLWFSLPFVVNGIINIGNGTGMLVSMAVLSYGISYEKVNHRVTELWCHPGSRGLLLFLAAVAAACFLIAAVETIGMVRAASNRPPKNTTAVVLGCSVKGEKPSRVLEERLNAAYAYLVENPKAYCVLSGGQGRGEAISEAECMYRYLTERGIDGRRLLLEDASVNTEENLRFSGELLEEHGLSGDITIVTSEFHAYRAHKTAERLGMKSYSTPSRTFFLYLPTYYVRELYGILYYMIR